MDAKSWAKRIVGADWSYDRSDDYSKYNKGLGIINKMVIDAESEYWSIDDIESIKEEINNLLDGNLKGVYSDKGRESLINKVEWLKQLQKKAV